MKGLIHVYCGEGKGKTTAAIGLGIRACGSGKRVLLTQFLKSENTSERKILQKIDGWVVTKNPEIVKFTFEMTEEEKKLESAQCSARLQDTATNVQNFDLVILDEVFGAISAGMLQQQELVDLIKNKPESLELVLTGRNPNREILQLADYVTEMNKVKHPYDNGIAARKGIEY